MFTIPICKFDFDKEVSVRRYSFDSVRGFTASDDGDYVPGVSLHSLLEHVNSPANRRRHKVELHIKYGAYTSQIFVKTLDEKVMPYDEYSDIVDRHNNFIATMANILKGMENSEMEAFDFSTVNDVYPVPVVIKEWHVITKNIKTIDMTSTVQAVIPYSYYIKYSRYLHIVKSVKELVQAVKVCLIIEDMHS